MRDASASVGPAMRLLILPAFASLAALMLLLAPERAASQGTARLRVAAWVPYWNRAEGTVSARQHLDALDELSPFGFEVQADGTLVDKTARRPGRWNPLLRAARRRGVKVIPSLIWLRADEQRAVLGDPALRAAHIARVVEVARRPGVDGVDIDYEGRDGPDRAMFATFLSELRAALAPLGKTLVCTVEGREGESPPPGANAGQRMAYSVDFQALGRECDAVRLMAYGQWYLQHGERSFTNAGTAEGREPHAPNSSDGFAERVVRYALRHVPAERLLLGVPTHGRVFRVGGEPGAWTYESRGAIHEARFLELAARPTARVDRPAGERRLRIGSGPSRRLAYLADATTLRGRIALARRLGIAGVALFKIDGREAAGLWEVLTEARR